MHGLTNREGKETYYCATRKKYKGCKGKLIWDEKNQELRVQNHIHDPVKDEVDLEIELYKVNFFLTFFCIFILEEHLSDRRSGPECAKSQLAC